jgi:hypothetical protein
MSSGPVPTGGDPGGFPGGDPLGKSCTSSACVKALGEVVSAGNTIKLKCGQVAAAAGWRDAMWAVGIAFATAAIAAFAGAAVATATIFGISLGALLFWIGVTLAATALLFFAIAAGLAIQVAVLQGELNGARTSFVNATNDVMTACPTTCWGDLAMPSC